MAGRYHVCDRLVHGTTVAAFAARLVAVLEELTAQPNMAVGAVSVLTDAERAELGAGGSW